MHAVRVAVSLSVIVRAVGVMEVTVTSIMIGVAESVTVAATVVAEQVAAVMAIMEQVAAVMAIMTGGGKKAVAVVTAAIMGVVREQEQRVMEMGMAGGATAVVRMAVGTVEEQVRAATAATTTGTAKAEAGEDVGVRGGGDGVAGDDGEGKDKQGGNGREHDSVRGSGSGIDKVGGSS